MTIPTGLAKPQKISFQNVQLFIVQTNQQNFIYNFFCITYLKMNLFEINLLLQIFIYELQFFIYDYQNGYFYFYVFEILNFSYR